MPMPRSLCAFYAFLFRIPCTRTPSPGNVSLARGLDWSGVAPLLVDRVILHRPFGSKRLVDAVVSYRS